jgi:hypothetical protein
VSLSTTCPLDVGNIRILWHCLIFIFITASVYGSWLPCWYIHAFILTYSNVCIPSTRNKNENNNLYFISNQIDKVEYLTKGLILQVRLLDIWWKYGLDKYFIVSTKNTCCICQ